VATSQAIAALRPLTDAVWQATQRLLLVAVIGFLAIGLSGVLEMDMGAAFGHRFVYADQPGGTYTSARCADFLEYHPEARTCAAAADAHHFHEVAY
jgi:hypothetical protein